MTIRLNKVTRDLNVGIATAVEFLEKQGFTVEANPNTKITDEQFDLLKKEFSKDKDLKDRSEKFIQNRQKKEQAKSQAATAPESRPAASASADVTEVKRPVFIGKIDLSQIGKNHSAVKPATSEATAKVETPAPVQPKEAVPAPAKPEATKPVEAPVETAKVEVKKPEPVATVTTTAPKTEKPQAEKPQPEKPKAEEPKPAPVQTPKQTETEKMGEVDKDNGVFRLHNENIETGINVIGKIDLDAINLSTRPKRKSKEERKREQEERDRQRADQRRQLKETLIHEIRHDGGQGGNNAANSDDSQGGKKKRQRINKEKVDINSVSSSIRGNDRGNDDRQQGGKRFGGDRPIDNGSGKKGGRDRFGKKGPLKKEVNEEDVAKQVKETLARLTTKTKSKGVKYRKEKRELASERLHEQESQEMAESKVLKITEFVTANELAIMMDVPVTQVIATCMSIGVMVSINQRLDAETINLVAEEFGYNTEYVSAEVAQAVDEAPDKEEDLTPRAPIVTVMGHVDHGKTSLLDYIRKSNVIAGEAGGITQHIGAYNVTLDDGRKITFLDTPGHEAFTAMRARGAKVTDIAIIIVAADDSVMPQTKEAINHATAAGVPIIFAINKIDKPGANPDKIKEELAAMNFLVEDWGGKYQSQDISAKQGTGVPELMEKVLLEAELLDLKANPNRKATGSIIESSLDKGRGYVATVLVSNGTLKVGDIVLAGANYGRVKAMFNERNQRMEKAGPSEPALILGLNGAPAAGDTFHVFDTDQEAREIANKREQLQREQGLRTQKTLTLDEIGRRLAKGEFHEMNIIVKGDVDGSVEALSDSLIKLTTDKIQVNVIHKGVGQISESDVTLAAASDAIIVGFQVRPSAAASKMAEQDGVDIRKYSIIYDAIAEVKSAMEGMLAPTQKEQVTATLDVREVFNISKVGLVAGAMVKTGKVKRTDKARIIRDGIVVFTGNINALKRFKDDVKEVGTNFECGISLTACNDLKVGDVIETFEVVEVKQTL